MTNRTDGSKSPDHVSVGVVRERFDWTDVSPSTAVLETVKKATGTDPTELAPLYEYVDPDSLDSMCAHTTPNEASVRVSFDYSGVHVSVASDGLVAVCPSDTPVEFR